ncbi:MAG: hypothetical protein RML94_09260 [Bacteroidia bacterium]|nr:hypothetical protein [Bacteroidia bacterium]
MILADNFELASSKRAIRRKHKEERVAVRRQAKTDSVKAKAEAKKARAAVKMTRQQTRLARRKRRFDIVKAKHERRLREIDNENMPMVQVPSMYANEYSEDIVYDVPGGDYMINYQGDVYAQPHDEEYESDEQLSAAAFMPLVTTALKGVVRGGAEQVKKGYDELIYLRQKVSELEKELSRRKNTAIIAGAGGAAVGFILGNVFKR